MKGLLILAFSKEQDSLVRVIREVFCPKGARVPVPDTGTIKCKDYLNSIFSEQRMDDDSKFLNKIHDIVETMMYDGYEYVVGS